VADEPDAENAKEYAEKRLQTMKDHDLTDTQELHLRRDHRR
jgi:hypothetical protein